MSRPLKVIVLSAALAVVSLPSVSIGMPPVDFPLDTFGVAQNEYVAAFKVDRFTQKIEQNSEDADAFMGRGVAYQEIGEVDKAMADFTEAIRLNPSHDWAFIGRAATWSLKGEHDKAISDYNEAIRLNPKAAAASCTGIGFALHNQHEFDNAIAKFDEAIQIDPKFTGAYQYRGAAWLAKGNPDKATADLGEAIRLNPKRVFALTCRGLAFQSKGKLTDAIIDYDKAIELNPKAKWAYQLRAWLRATCPDETFRDGVKAIADAEKVCEMTDYENAGDLDTLAAAYADAGQFNRAVEWQEKAIELAPESKKEEFGTRLALYLAKNPYREEPGKQ